MTATTSNKPQDSLVASKESGRPQPLLNSSMSLVAEVAEEVKRLRMENTRVAATLMRKEKA